MSDKYNIPIFRGRDKKRFVLYGETQVILELVNEFKSKGMVITEYISDEESIDGLKRVYLEDFIDVPEDSYILIIASENNISYYADKVMDSNIKYYTIEDLQHLYDDVPTVPCHMMMLSIDSLGNIYPCCKIIDKLVIGNLCDTDIVEKIKNYGSEPCLCSIARIRKATGEEWEEGISRLAMELCGPCQADCTYCYENVYDNFKVKFPFIEQLENLITNINCNKIVAYGGELLCQQDVLQMFRRVKEKKNDLVIDLPTNGNFDSCVLDSVEDIFNEFEISFSGFSSATYSTIMGIPFEKTVKFVEELNKRKKNLYSLKMLVSPLCIAEAPQFLEWAFSMNPTHAILHIADVYKHPCKTYTSEYWEGNSFSSCNKLYWEPLLARIKKSIEDVIIRNKETIIENNINIVIPKNLLSLLNIDNDFWSKNGLENNFGAKSTMILNNIS